MPADDPIPRRLNWLLASRMQQWAHFLLLPLAGYEKGTAWVVNVTAFSRGVLTAFGVLAFGFLLNQVADRHMDSSVQKNPFVRGHQGTVYRGPLIALASVALGASLFGPWIATAATALALMSGAVYSVGPRLKRFPGIGTLANASNFTPLLWVGLPSGAACAGMGALTACFALLLLQNQLVHEAADREDDRRGNVLTTFRLLGPRSSAFVIAVLGALVVGVAVGTPALTPLTVPLALVFAVVTPLVAALRGTQSAFMARVRLAHRGASILAGGAVFWMLRAG